MPSERIEVVIRPTHAFHSRLEDYLLECSVSIFVYYDNVRLIRPQQRVVGMKGNKMPRLSMSFRWNACTRSGRKRGREEEFTDFLNMSVPRFFLSSFSILLLKPQFYHFLEFHQCKDIFMYIVGKLVKSVPVVKGCQKQLSDANHVPGQEIKSK